MREGIHLVPICLASSKIIPGVACSHHHGQIFIKEGDQTLRGIAILDLNVNHGEFLVGIGLDGTTD